MVDSLRIRAARPDDVEPLTAIRREAILTLSSEEGGGGDARVTGRTRQLRIASAARLRSIRSVLRKRRDNQSDGSRSSATESKECTYDRITYVEGLALLCSPTPRNESGLPGTQLLNSTLAGMLSSSTSTGATSRSRSGCPRGARWSSTSHRMPPRRATDHARGRSLGTASERAAAACHKGPQRTGTCV